MKSEDNSRFSLFNLSAPIFIEQLMSALVLMTDAYFFSQISDEVAGTIGILLPIVFLGSFIIPIFTSASTSVASQFIGGEQAEKINPVFVINLILSILLGTILGFTIFGMSGSIGSLMGMTPSGAEYTHVYLQIMAVHFTFLAAKFGFGTILAAHGKTQWNMYTSLLTASLNIVFNIIFFLVLDLGLAGIAWATVLSYIVGAFTAFVVAKKLTGYPKLKSLSFAESKSVLKPVIKIGVPSALEPVSYLVQQIVISVIIIQIGVAALAATTYTGRFISLVITFSWALSYGGQILMARHMGAREFSAVSAVYWRCMKWTSGVAFLVMLLIYLNAESILTIFTQDNELIQLCKTLLAICVVMEPARAINIISGQALKGVGDAAFSAKIGIIFMWGIIPIVIGGYAFLGWGIVLIWACFCIDEAIRANVNIWRWRSERWQDKGVVISQKPATT